MAEVHGRHGLDGQRALIPGLSPRLSIRSGFCVAGVADLRRASTLVPRVLSRWDDRQFPHRPGDWADLAYCVLSGNRHTIGFALAAFRQGPAATEASNRNRQLLADRQKRKSV